MSAIVMSIVLCYLTPIKAQSDSLNIWVDQVEQILFAEEDYNCYLYEFMECKEIQKPVYDSFQLVNCYQPEVNQVNSLLEKILWTKDPGEYDQLLRIYKHYMDQFLDQFEQVIRDNYYNCKFILDRWSIVSNFEMLLISLEFKKKGWSNLRIYNYYKNEEIKKVSERRNLSKYTDIVDTFQYRFILKDYKNLHRYAPEHRHYHTFHYVDPYVDNIEPYFIKDLYECDYCYRNESGHPEMDCYLVRRSQFFIEHYKSDSIELYFLDNFDCWNSLSFRGRFLTNYAINADYTQLMSKIMDSYLIRTSETGKDYYLQDFIRRVLQNSNYLPLLMDKIIKIGEEDLEFAKNRLSYIPWEYREEAKSYIKHNAPKKSKLYQSLVKKGEKIED
jgi:hypothetical protein